MARPRSSLRPAPAAPRQQQGGTPGPPSQNTDGQRSSASSPTRSRIPPQAQKEGPDTDGQRNSPRSDTQSRTPSQPRTEGIGLTPSHGLSSRNLHPRSSMRPAAASRRQKHMRDGSPKALSLDAMNRADRSHPGIKSHPLEHRRQRKSVHRMALRNLPSRLSLLGDDVVALGPIRPRPTSYDTMTSKSHQADRTDDDSAPHLARKETDTGKAVLKQVKHKSTVLETSIHPARDKTSPLAKVSSPGSYIPRPGDAIQQSDDKQAPVSQFQLFNSTDASPSSHLQRLPDELLLEVLKPVTRCEGLIVLWSFDVNGPVLCRGFLSTFSELRLIPSTGGDCPWLVMPHMKQYVGPKIGRILRLRSVNRHWGQLVADEFFRNNSIIFQHEKTTKFSVPTSCDVKWFVPRGTTNGMEDMQITIRYQRYSGKLRRTFQYEQILACRCEVICLGKAPGSWNEWKFSQTAHQDQDPFVKSDPDEGLQVQGYYFYTKLTGVPFLGRPWAEVIQVFIWTLMDCPDDAPKEDGKFVLNLGMY